MRLKCPVCDAHNDFDPDEPMVCRSCGFSSDQVEGPQEGPAHRTPDNTAPQAAAPPEQPEAHAQPSGTTWDPAPAASMGPPGHMAHPHHAYAQGPDTRPVDPVSVTALITGILALVFGWMFFLILPLVAVVLGIIGITRTGERDPHKGRGYAVTGLVLGVIGLVFGFFAMIFWMIFAGGGPWWSMGDW